ncbi:MAG TPA: MarR family transcriptional regulator [Micromonosporaceae bacterium]|jgi:DNA-binding MarR family transcriptional regulator
MGDARDNELIDGLVQASFTVMALLTQVAAEHDLSLTQLRVLAILRDRQPRMADLADHLGLERSSVSGLIDRALRRGLVQRETSADDARAVRLSLTPAGRRLAQQGTEQVAALLAPLTAGLNAAERTRLGSLLTRMLPSG